MTEKKIEKISKKDFQWIKWKREDIQKIPEEIKQNLKKKISKIKKIKKEDRTFKNTILALEYINSDFEEKINQVSLLFNLISDKEIRETAFITSLEIWKNLTNLFFDKKLYQSILEYKEKKEKLNKVDKKLLEEHLKSFKKLGLDLNDKKQKELKKITHKIDSLSSKFQKNINDYQDSIILPKKEIAGLSENYLETLKKDKNGNFIVTLAYSDYGTFISKSENEKLRKELIEKNLKKGGIKNLKILNQILELKKQKAKILGYKNYAEYILNDRMAQTPENVNLFLDDIYKKIKKESLNDENDILNYKIKYTKNKKDKLYFYDVGFYLDKLEKEKFNLDTEKLREYFVLDDVLKNMFDIFGKLFNFKTEELKIKLWNKDARMFILKRNKKDIAYLAMDLFPREGKYSHACMTNWKDGYLKEDQKVFQLPITTLICNFRKSTKKLPSLLSFDEVNTLFHEFGHALHNSLTKAKYPSFSGTNVKWDFVETPSQLLENWLAEEKVLNKISKHYLTKKPLSKDIVLNLIESLKFQKASFYAQQVIFGILDMQLHTKNIKNPQKLFLKLKKNITNIKPSKDTIFPASFSHIVGGYGAGYYSYLYSEVFSDDIYSKFKKEGIFSKKTGKKYLEEILEKGSEREEINSLKNFLGRKPNNKAFLKKIK